MGKQRLKPLYNMQRDATSRRGTPRRYKRTMRTRTLDHPRRGD